MTGFAAKRIFSTALYNKEIDFLPKMLSAGYIHIFYTSSGLSKFGKGTLDIGRKFCQPTRNSNMEMYQNLASEI